MKRVPDDVSLKSVPITIVTKTVLINDDEEAEVAIDAEENWYLLDPKPVNDTVMKCVSCKLPTIHQGYEFRINPDLAAEAPKGVRVYMCCNCGKVTTK